MNESTVVSTDVWPIIFDVFRRIVQGNISCPSRVFVLNRYDFCFGIIDLVQVQIGSRMFDQTFVITLLT